MWRSARRMHRDVAASSVVPTASCFHVAPKFGSRDFGRFLAISDRLGALSTRQHQPPQLTRPLTSPSATVAAGGRYRYKFLFRGPAPAVSTLLLASFSSAADQRGLVGVAFGLVAIVVQQHRSQARLGCTLVVQMTNLGRLHVFVCDVTLADRASHKIPVRVRV